MSGTRLSKVPIIPRNRYNFTEFFMGAPPPGIKKIHTTSESSPRNKKKFHTTSRSPGRKQLQATSPCPPAKKKKNLASGQPAGQQKKKKSIQLHGPPPEIKKNPYNFTLQLHCARFLKQLQKPPPAKKKICRFFHSAEKSFVFAEVAKTNFPEVWRTGGFSGPCPALYRFGPA